MALQCGALSIEISPTLSLSENASSSGLQEVWFSDASPGVPTCPGGSQCMGHCGQHYPEGGPRLWCQSRAGMQVREEKDGNN